MLTNPRFDEITWLAHGFGDRDLTAAALGCDERLRTFRAVLLRQVHSDIVHVLDRAPEESPHGDALITHRPGLLLVVKTADCLPVLLVDEARRVVAAVHCGWRGTLRGVLERTIACLRDRCGVDPRDLLTALGPCIGRQCYEVGDEVRGRFAEAGYPDGLFRPLPQHPAKFLFDLADANRLQLVRAGVDPGNIFGVAVCTHCDPHFHSFRRDRQRAGRMLSFIGIIPGNQKAR